MATVLLTPEAVSDIQGLPAPIVARMQGLIERLGRWPDVSGVKPLTGALAGKYRLRTGDYRLQFRIISTPAPTDPASPAAAQPPPTGKKGKGKKGKGKKGEKQQKALVYKVIVEKAGHRDGFYEER